MIGNVGVEIKTIYYIYVRAFISDFLLILMSLQQAWE